MPAAAYTTASDRHPRLLTKEGGQGTIVPWPLKSNHGADPRRWVLRLSLGAAEKCHRDSPRAIERLVTRRGYSRRSPERVRSPTMYTVAAMMYRLLHTMLLVLRVYYGAASQSSRRRCLLRGGVVECRGVGRDRRLHMCARTHLDRHGWMRDACAYLLRKQNRGSYPMWSELIYSTVVREPFAIQIRPVPENNGPK